MSRTRPDDPTAPRRGPRVLWLLPALLLGCAGEGAAQPVEGRLLLDGKPAANAFVAFHPAGAAGPGAARPVAVTGPDGAYRLTTFAAGDGAPAGEYVVTVVWPDPAVPVDECACEDATAHDRLRGDFADPSKPRLVATVRPGKNEITLRAAVPESVTSRPRDRWAGRRRAGRDASFSLPGSSMSTNGGPKETRTWRPSSL